MPLDSVIQMMCTLNHVLNGEKLNVSDFQVREAQSMEKFDYEMPVSESDIYKSYNIENQINALHYELVYTYTREVHMSRSHLSILFNKRYGRNLIDYIHKIKIAKAKELLKDHGKSITQIADYLGYSSSSHFTRVFCSIEGVTPKEYRKNTPIQS